MKKKSKKRIFTIIILIIQIISVCLFANGSKLVYDAGGKSFASYVSNCSYYAIESVYSEDIKMSQLFKTITNESGDIVMISTDAHLVNLIAKTVALKCYDLINERVKAGFNLPIGAFSGVDILAGCGEKINVKLISVLSVECKLKRTFVSAGINQTRQTLSAIIHTEITVFSILRSRNYCEEIEMLLFDNVVVGKVPESYLVAEIVGSSIKKG